MKQVLLSLVIASLYFQASFAQQNALQSKSLYEVKATGMSPDNFILTENASLILTNRLNDYFSKDSVPAKMNNSQLSEQYFAKGRNFETIGFVLLGVGTAAGIGGYVGTLNHYDIFDGTGSGYVVLWLAGVGSAITGTVLLARGFHYKRKAKLVMHNENISYSYHVPIKSNVFSVGIAFNLK